VEIRLVSSLTSDDELRMAPAVMEAIRGFLNNLPIAYTLRVRTADGKGFAQHHVPAGGLGGANVDLAGLAVGTHA